MNKHQPADLRAQLAELHEQVRRLGEENTRLTRETADRVANLEQRLNERTAEMTALNKELEAFAYSVSHDLRAPIRSIDGFSLALLEDYGQHLNPEAQDYLTRIRTATLRMGQLIDDMLTLSRLSRTRMRRQTIDLSAMARRIAKDLLATEPQRQVEFRIAEPLTVRGDAALINSLMESLLGNAWKFSSKNPTALIEFGAVDEPSGNAEPAGGARTFFVRDDGAGFDMSYASKLFGAFQRLHTAQQFPGAGVGLAFVQRIIHRHGGRVWAQGAPGKGATFYFTLAATPHENAAPALAPMLRAPDRIDDPLGEDQLQNL